MKFKQLALMVVATLCSAGAMAQVQIDAPCTKNGSFMSVPRDTVVDTAICQSGKWAWFKQGGEQRVRISYSLTGDGVNRTGTVTTVDGVPSTISQAIERPYTVSVIVRAGERVVLQNMAKVGYSMQLVPRLKGDGTMTLVVQYSETGLHLKSEQEVAANPGERQGVDEVSTLQSVAMELGKELVLPIQGVGESPKSNYTLKLVGTLI